MQRSADRPEATLRAGGPGVIERLIRFLDLDGRSLALRYDFTASIARVASTVLGDQAPPLRLCYSGKVYRQEPDRGARPREILQVGAELLGAGGVDADLEIIRLTVALLSSAGVRDFQINVGHVGALAPALDAVSARSGRIRVLLEFTGEFDGMDRGAAWQDMKMGARDWSAWERIALVTDHPWMREGLAMFSWAVPGEAKAFPSAQRQVALDWLSEP